jgi:hypothetical protein
MKSFSLSIRAIVLFALATIHSSGAVLVWTNTAGGNWSGATNWSPNQAPGAADQAFITNAGTYSVTVSANATVNQLTLGGGSGVQTLLQSDGTVTPASANIVGTGQWRLQSGSLGGVLLIAPGATFSIEGGSGKTLSAIVTNRGTFQLSGSGDVSLTGSLDNEGLFALAGDVRMYPPFNITRPLRNTGTIRKTSGTGAADLGVAGNYFIALTNSGTIESLSGAISHFGVGLLDGFLKTTNGTRIDFVGHTYTHSGSGSPIISGNGATRLTGGTISLHDSIPGLQLVGGSVQLLPDFQGGAGITNLVLDGVSLSGTNTVTGNLTFRSGSLGGVLLIAPGATFSIEGGSGKTLSAIVTNRGTFQLSGSGDVSLTGSLDNEGLFALAGDVRMYPPFNVTRPLRNTGTIRKTAGTGAADLGVAGNYFIALTNSGTIESLSGAISHFGVGLLDGFLKTTNGTRIDFVGHTYTHSGSGSPIISGNGATRLTGGTISLHDSIPGLQLVGGSVQLLPDFQGGAGITNLVLDGVSLSGTNTVTGNLTFRSGSLGGVLLIAPGATFSIEGGSGKTLSAIVTNRGTFQLSGSGDVSLTGSLDNEGLFALAGDVRMYPPFNVTRPLRNTGTIRKTAGTGAADLGVAGNYFIALTNSGTIESLSGAISHFGVGLLDGFLKTTNGTRIDFVGHTYTHSGSGSPIISGNGATRLTGGTISLHDSIPGLQLVGGSVQLLPDFQGGAGITNLVLDGVSLSGTNTVTGNLTFRSGSLGGVLLIAPGATFSIEGGSGKTLSAIVTNRGTFQLQRFRRRLPHRQPRQRRPLRPGRRCPDVSALQRHPPPAQHRHHPQDRRHRRRRPRRGRQLLHRADQLRHH